MMKRLFRLSLVLLMCMSFLLPLTALHAEDKTYVIDENGWLNDESISQINQEAAKIEADTGVEFLFGFVQSDPTEALNTIYDKLHTDAEKTVVFTLNEEYYYDIGSVGFELTQTDVDAMVTAFDQAPGIAEGSIEMMQAMMSPHNDPNVPATTTTTTNGSYDLLVDEAGLLSEYQQEELNARLKDISMAHGMDIAVVTVKSLNGYTSETFADDYFDEHGYGQNNTDDGIMLLVCPEERDYAYVTSGNAAYVFDDQYLAQLDNKVIEYLSADDYYRAFNVYASTCEKILVDFENEVISGGSTYEPTPQPQQKKGFDPIWIPGALGAGAVAGGVVMSSQRSQLKSVRKEESARSYVTAKGLQLFDAREYFLYRTVSKTPRPQNNSRSGHTSTMHTTSSGHSHGGRSGKY